MKKVLTVILTLILGVCVNVFVGIGLFALGFLAWGHFDGAEYVVAAAGTVLFAALLSFLAVKLNKIVSGAAFILCAQLPAVIWWAISYLTEFSDGGGGNLFGLIVSGAAMLSALIVWVIIEKKNMPKDRENKPIPQNRLMRKLNEWWNEPL